MNFPLCGGEGALRLAKDDEVEIGTFDTAELRSLAYPEQGIPYLLEIDWKKKYFEAEQNMIGIMQGIKILLAEKMGEYDSLGKVRR